MGIMGGTAAVAASEMEAKEKSGFRIVVLVKSPGARAAYASVGLRQAMADAEAFTARVMVIMGSLPHMSMLRTSMKEGIGLKRADLEELEIPRTAPCLQPPPEP